MAEVRNLKITGWGMMFAAGCILTNRFTNLETDRKLITEASDSYAYLAIASAAPGLPSERVQFQHGQRMAVPYLLGVAADLTPVSLHRWFLAAVVVIEISIVAIFSSILARLSLGEWQSRVVLAMLVLNPWGFRYALTFPEMVNDIGFVLGLAIMIRGLVTGSTWNVLAGQIIASVCRQTGLLIVPMALLWLWRREGQWARVSYRHRVLTCVSLVMIAAGIYSLTSLVAAQFSSSDMNAAYAVDGIRWLRNDFSAAGAAEHLASLIVSLFVGLSVLAIAIKRLRPSESSHVSLLLLGAASIWVQPFLSGPKVAFGNGERLTTIALLPLLTAVAILLRETGIFSYRKSWVGPLLAIVALVVMSLHHLYSADWTPFAGNRFQFEIAYATGAVAVTVISYLDRRRSYRP